MQGDLTAALVWIVAIALAILLFSRLTSEGKDEGGRSTGSRVGPGSAGTIYDWLNQEKRNAVEIIVEEKAGARDPEDKDGNLPELAKGSGVKGEE